MDDVKINIAYRCILCWLVWRRYLVSFQKLKQGEDKSAQVLKIESKEFIFCSETKYQFVQLCYYKLLLFVHNQITIHNPKAVQSIFNKLSDHQAT